MTINSQINLEKASEKKLLTVAKTTTDCNVMAALAKKPYMSVLMSVASSDVTTSETLDTLAKDLVDFDLYRNEKIMILTRILTNKNCGQNTIKYILGVKEYEKMVLYDDAEYTSLRQYALDKIPYIAPSTIKSLYENGGLYSVCEESGGLYPEMIINHFKNISPFVLEETVKELRKLLPANQFKRIPIFIEYIVIGLAQNTNLYSYQIHALLDFINEYMILKPLLFSAGNKKEMFYSFATNEKTGKEVLNYLSAIDDERIRKAILKHPNASEELLQTLRTL